MSDELDKRLAHVIKNFADDLQEAANGEERIRYITVVVTEGNLQVATNMTGDVEKQAEILRAVAEGMDENKVERTSNSMGLDDSEFANERRRVDNDGDIT